jgi:hypothetical protein
VAEYDAHLSSYDHHHRKRLKELHREHNQRVQSACHTWLFFSVVFSPTFPTLLLPLATDGLLHRRDKEKGGQAAGKGAAADHGACECARTAAAGHRCNCCSCGLFFFCSGTITKHGGRRVGSAAAAARNAVCSDASAGNGCGVCSNSPAAAATSRRYPATTTRAGSATAAAATTKAGSATAAAAAAAAATTTTSSAATTNRK